jgi:hypothetical protein
LEELKKQLDGRDLLGSNPRERLMLEAADRFVAQAKVEEKAQDRDALAEDVRQRITDLWASVPPAKPSSS